MFPSRPSSPLAQRLLGALRLTRSFLLLEDDYHVDWEVDRNETALRVHPHRAALPGRPAPRRPGQVGKRSYQCLSPVAGPPARPQARSVTHARSGSAAAVPATRESCAR